MEINSGHAGGRKDGVFALVVMGLATSAQSRGQGANLHHPTGAHQLQDAVTEQEMRRKQWLGLPEATNSPLTLQFRDKNGL